ncbi:hypothetical protein KAR02_06560, partial [Candidatus Bipolaricaulota bacterium]|nr:hypothetical protein [Candidatus Bipolaricaulota bacterium]
LRMNQEHGTTLIIVTHDPEAAVIADRIIRLRDGHVADESRRVPEGSENEPSAAGSASEGDSHA